MAYGSYSSLSVGCLGGEEYDIMAENLGGRVFFAGEATTRKYPATMHGAFHTGLREVPACDTSCSFLSTRFFYVTNNVTNNVLMLLPSLPF
jgi:hypothetical protein